MPGRILVVDNVSTNRIVLKVKLAAACYEVFQAGCGAEALHIAQRDRPDMILLDWSLPDIETPKLCRRLKADPRTAGIPVIAMTPANDTAANLAALTAGAEDFMSKPIDDVSLLARVRSLLRAQSVTNELALREGTSQALGFAEPAQDFQLPGHICVAASQEAQAMVWRRRLAARLHDRVDAQTREGALSYSDKVPDLFVVLTDPQRPAAGLQLISELRARPDTRHAGIIAAIGGEDPSVAALALDLGASDVVTAPIDADELELRLKFMLARKRQADRLRRQVRDGLQLAVTDPLTGLYNRRYAMSHLSRVRSHAIDANKTFAVMLVDLDRFKQVNDLHGHAAGDQVLQSVAATLAGNLRNVDLVARIGGEEFMVILPNIGPGPARNAAERLREAVAAAPITVQPRLDAGLDGVIRQTISIGVVTGNAGPNGHEETVDQLLERADQALYRSKSGGRNIVTHEVSARAAA